MPYTLPLSWQEHASCAGMETEMFFTPLIDAPGRQLEELPTIRRMCAACPVQSECSEHAIKHEAFGVWAGLTARDREEIRRKRGIFLDRPENVRLSA